MHETLLSHIQTKNENKITLSNNIFQVYSYSAFLYYIYKQNVAIMSFFISSVPFPQSPPNSPCSSPQKKSRLLDTKTARAASFQQPSLSINTHEDKKRTIATGFVTAKVLPLPYNADFSNWDRQVEQNTSEEHVIPPTPRKKTSQTALPRFKTIYDSLQSGTFNDMHVSECGRGSYSAVYEIQEKPHLVLKAYHGKMDEGFSESALQKLIKHSCQNYRDIAALNLPVAELVNLETAKHEGFFLQKKIPHEIDIQNPLHVQQAQKFFSLSVEKKIAMDLQPQNLRVTNDNQVVLIDFIEEKDSINIFITKACRAWVDFARAKGFSKKAGRDLLQALTSSFLDKHDTFTSAWLTEIVGD